MLPLGKLPLALCPQADVLLRVGALCLLWGPLAVSLGDAACSTLQTLAWRRRHPPQARHPGGTVAPLGASLCFRCRERGGHGWAVPCELCLPESLQGHWAPLCSPWALLLVGPRVCARRVLMSASRTAAGWRGDQEWTCAAPSAAVWESCLPLGFPAWRVLGGQQCWWARPSWTTLVRARWAWECWVQMFERDSTLWMPLAGSSGTWQRTCCAPQTRWMIRGAAFWRQLEKWQSPGLASSPPRSMAVQLPRPAEQVHLTRRGACGHGIVRLIGVCLAQAARRSHCCALTSRRECGQLIGDAPDGSQFATLRMPWGLRKDWAHPAQLPVKGGVMVARGAPESVACQLGGPCSAAKQRVACGGTSCVLRCCLGLWRVAGLALAMDQLARALVSKVGLLGLCCSLSRMKLQQVDACDALCSQRLLCARKVKVAEVQGARCGARRAETPSG